LLVSVGHDDDERTVHVWDVQRNAVLHSWSPPGKVFFTRLAVGAAVLGIGAVVAACTSDGEVWLLDVHSSKMVRVLAKSEDSTRPDSLPVEDLQATADGIFLATTVGDEPVRFWQMLYDKDHCTCRRVLRWSTDQLGLFARGVNVTGATDLDERTVALLNQGVDR